MNYENYVIVIEQIRCKMLQKSCFIYSHVLQELNVKVVNTSTDKEKYGVHLKAEPDFRTLGARLGAGLKQVMAACKTLTSEQLAVRGHRDLDTLIMDILISV